MTSKKKNTARIIVLSGALFMLLVFALMKLIGDGPVVPCVFILGWIVLALVTIGYFRMPADR